MDVRIGELNIVSNRVSSDLVPSLGELESIGWHQDLLILEGDFGDISVGATKIDIERVLPFSAKNKHASSKHAHDLSNMRKLLTVHDCIEIRGRGMMLVGLAEDAGADLQGQETFTLITKSGDMYPATAIAVEQFNMHRSHVVQIGILVGEQLAHLDWLIDSEVWIDSSS